MIPKGFSTHRHGKVGLPDLTTQRNVKNDLLLVKVFTECMLTLYAACLEHSEACRSPTLQY